MTSAVSAEEEATNIHFQTFAMSISCRPITRKALPVESGTASRVSNVIPRRLSAVAVMDLSKAE